MSRNCGQRRPTLFKKGKKPIPLELLGNKVVNQLTKIVKHIRQMTQLSATSLNQCRIGIIF
jgi:hypothetical protein